MCFVQKETGDIINDSDAIANEAKHFFMITCMPHEKMKLWI